MVKVKLPSPSTSSFDAVLAVTPWSSVMVLLFREMPLLAASKVMPFGTVTDALTPFTLCTFSVMSVTVPVALLVEAWTLAVDDTPTRLLALVVRAEMSPTATPASPSVMVVLAEAVSTTATSLPFRSFWVLNSVVLPILLISEDSWLISFCISALSESVLVPLAAWVANSFILCSMLWVSARAPSEV